MSANAGWPGNASAGGPKTSERVRCRRRVASVLSELPQARKVELREGELTVFPAPGQRLFEVVSDTVRENRWAVAELRLEAGRLDEVFRQITRGEVS